MLLIFFWFQYSAFTRQTQSFRFGDESEHLTPAWMILKTNKKLYRDLSTNHQPIPVFTSLVFLKVVQYQNVFMFVERLRQFMLFTSLLGALVLVARLGWVGLIASLLIETSKFYFLGYHLLAESLVIYPIMILIGILFRHLFLTSNQVVKEVNVLENIIFGLSIVWVAFSLLPAWPFLLLSTVAYLSFQKKSTRLLTTLVMLFITLAIFSVISPYGWFKDTIVNNFKFFIPYESEVKSFHSWILIAVYPLRQFLNLGSAVGFYIAALIIVLLAALFVLLVKAENKLSFLLKVVFLYILVILLNVRVTEVDVGFYTAFHVLPQVAVLTILSVLFSKLAISNIWHKSHKYLFSVLFAAIVVTLLISNTRWWQEKKDKMNEHFIQYGEIQSLGSALNALKLNGDNLLAGPLEGLMNISSDIPLAGRQTAYLGWIWRSETFRDEFHNMMRDTPPTFIYFPAPPAELQSYLINYYTRFLRKDGGKTDTYIFTSEITRRSTNQWKEFEELFYRIPEEYKTLGR